RRDRPSYVAGFRSAAAEDFSRRVPDSSTEFARTAEEIDRWLSGAIERCSLARSEFRRALEMQERAEQELAEAERARDDAGRLEGTTTRELAAIEGEARGVDIELAEAEQNVPKALRTAPPRWALWLWL